MYCAFNQHPDGSCYARGLDQCGVCAKYQAGEKPARFPVPAKIVEVHVTPFGVDSPFHSTILWCENEVIKACVDFNFDRCMDFGYGVGVYVNEREMNEGINRWLSSTT